LRIPVVAVVDTNCDPDVIDYVIPGNDDAIRSAQLMCRVISDAVADGRELGRRRNARPGTRAEDATPAAEAPKPERTPEEQAAFEQKQAEARAAAAAAQQEREARLAEQKAAATADDTTTEAATETTTEATTPETTTEADNG
jgi:small subunit ribosomal protein S2